jgi:hypothetical protein
MGWVKDLLRKEPDETFFGPVEPATDAAISARSPTSLPAGTVVGPESAYLHLSIEAMRISAVRIRGRAFYGSVTSTCSIQTGSGQAELVTVAAPSALRGLDPKHLDRVITGTMPLISAVPYLGGSLDMEIGLFALPEQYMLGPYLDFLGDVAAVTSAFLPVVGAVAAAALLPPVRKGLDQLFGAGTGATIELGVLRSLDPPVTGYCAAVRGVPEPARGFRIGTAGKLFFPDGTEVHAPYLVLRLDARTQRDTWRDIPEVLAAYHDLNTAVRYGEIPAAKSALERFRRMAVSSAGLLPQDAGRLHAKMEKFANENLFGTGTGALTPARGSSERVPCFPDLADIDLYAED